MDAGREGRAPISLTKLSSLITVVVVGPSQAEETKACGHGRYNQSNWPLPISSRLRRCCNGSIRLLPGSRPINFFT